MEKDLAEKMLSKDDDVDETFVSQKRADREKEFVTREDLTLSTKLKKSKMEGTPAKNDEKREKRITKEEKYRDYDERPSHEPRDEERPLEYRERDRWNRDRWEREKEKGERDEKLARDGEKRVRDYDDMDSVERRKAKLAESQKLISDDEIEENPPEYIRKKSKFTETEETDEKRRVDRDISQPDHAEKKEKKPKKT